MFLLQLEMGKESSKSEIKELALSKNQLCRAMLLANDATQERYFETYMYFKRSSVCIFASLNFLNSDNNHYNHLPYGYGDD